VRVFVQLGYGFGARDWNQRWRRGSIPGVNEEFPYGYHHARSDACAIVYSEDADETRLGKLVRESIRHTVGFDLIHVWRNRNGIRAADVIWTHTELEHLAVLLYLGLVAPSNRPKVIAQSVWLFDRWHQLPRIKRWIYRKLMQSADVLTVQSPENLRVLRESFPSHHTELIRYGINADAIVAPSLHPCHRPLRVVAFGNDHHRDWPTLIEAAAGDGGLELRIASSKIDPRLVRCAPNVRIVHPNSADAVENLYRWADIAVVALKPNLHVSGITAVAESIVMGVPVICTDTGGMRGYFSDDQICYVPPHRPDAIRTALQHYASDDQLRLRSLTRAQAAIKDRFTSTARAAFLASLSHSTISGELAVSEPIEAVPQ
jgi:glycosyltransferase involved in cell wall biosynthesis